MSEKSRVITGARAIFRIDGVNDIAYASECSYTINFNNQAIETLDKYTPIEYAPVGCTIECTCTQFQAINSSGSLVNDFSVLAGINDPDADILNSNTLTIDMVAKNNDGTEITVVSITGVRLVNQTGSLRARDAMNCSASFVGTSFSK